MADDFVITGTRPPSATGHRTVTASSKDFGYFTKKSQSTVDETLFQSHHTSSLTAPVNFPAPWEKKLTKTKGKELLEKKPKRGRPLLWAPPTASSHLRDQNNNNSNSNYTEPTKSFINDNDDLSIVSKSLSTIQGHPMKHQYRPIKHTPTFVDESLFGEPLQEPTFKAPWEEKKKVKQMLNWYPEQEHRPVRRRRPATALGLRGHGVSSSTVTVWKP